MKFISFDDFFLEATGVRPFPYQAEFATTDGLYELVNAPTGAGKTATAILGWLWRRRYAEQSVKASTPRRLVYCLPMRVLVEQTNEAASGWLSKLQLSDNVRVHVLMGGEEDGSWDLAPDRDAILMGTQDMLLSRALNRGYGESRFRWPIQFGLLNNDCLWVLDEIQLMGVGLATSTQLQAFRRKFGGYGPARTVWMSATLLPEWLRSVDFTAQVPELRTLALKDADYCSPGLSDRWIGKKPIEKARASSNDFDAVATIVREAHRPGSLTLVVVNKVDRARSLFLALQKILAQRMSKGRSKGSAQPKELPYTAPDVKLIHSRFRPLERTDWRNWLSPPWPEEGRIIISTQIVEAGVDLSARTLFTELAPWPSLVQRFGRCNRKGEFKENEPAKVFWIDVPAKDDKQAAPYSKLLLDRAREKLQETADVALKSLHEFFEALSDHERTRLFPFEPSHVIRRRDFVDLFDTTSDLAGNDIDVSRFIRDGDELDVQVFWREGAPPSGELEPKTARRLAPDRVELCPVPVGAFREFAEKAGNAVYHWDALNGKWIRAAPDALFPGQIFWIPKERGGYSGELGWDAKAPWGEDLHIYDPQFDDAPRATTEPEYDSDLLSIFGWRSIKEHTGDVMTELEAFISALSFGEIPWDIVRVAIRWHDWGKAHRIFQDAIKDDSEGEWKRPSGHEGSREVAKAAPQGFWSKYARRHFRHELASAVGVLTLLRGSAPPTDWATLSHDHQNLALYLIASHHGKVRLSIRSMPDEARPTGPDRLFARGLWHGDSLPGVALAIGVAAPTVDKLDMSPMQLGSGGNGSPSWAARVLGLRDDPDIGPLRLAFLEAIVRASDIRASVKTDKKGNR
jgi:CRISPR-associated endonuclease/helicase Cas3